MITGIHIHTINDNKWSPIIMDYEICPVCHSKSVMKCSCMFAERRCKHGHQWYMCPEHGTKIIGKPNYSKLSCQCGRIYK